MCLKMNLLLDTHTLLWCIENHPALSERTLLLIDDPSNNVFVSVVSFYEVAIKVNIGKMKLGKSIKEFYQQTIAAKIEVLPIASNYLETFAKLPLFPNHKDPFDRLIIATAVTEKVPIITADNKFEMYSEIIEIVW